jgi:hypothetical protein
MRWRGIYVDIEYTDKRVIESIEEGVSKITYRPTHKLMVVEDIIKRFITSGIVAHFALIVATLVICPSITPLFSPRPPPPTIHIYDFVKCEGMNA